MNPFWKKKQDIKKLSDSELIEKFHQEQKQEYFAELYQRYSHLVYGTCYKYLNNVSDSQDATMEVFEILYQQMNAKKNINSLNHWIYTVSKNTSLKWIKAQEKNALNHAFEIDIKENETLFMEKNLFDTLCEEENPFDDTIVNNAIQQLKKEQKECITAFFLERKTYKEISELYQYPIAKVKSYIQNGKRKLKIILLEHQSMIES